MSKPKTPNRVRSSELVSRQCPKCKSDEIEQLGSIDIHRPKKSGGWESYEARRFYKCNDCNHGWTNDAC